MVELKISHQDYIEYSMLVADGYSQRKACETLDIPRSTMQDYIKRLQVTKTLKDEPKDTGKPEPKRKAKIFVLDIETSCSLAAAFGRRKIFLSQDHIIREGGKILCFAFREIGTATTQLIGMTPEEAVADDDSRIVAELWELFERADAIVAHNAAKFDFPMIKTRVLANNMPPLPTVKVLDTLIMARKNFRFPANGLDALAAYLGIQRKKDAGGITTWILYSQGNTDAIEHMHEYCKVDVDVLHDVYVKLRSFGHIGSDFNAAHYTDKQDGLACNVCSALVYSTGRSVYTSASKFEELRCSGCGAVSRSRVAIVQTEGKGNDRSNFTSNVKING